MSFILWFLLIKPDLISLNGARWAGPTHMKIVHKLIMNANFCLYIVRLQWPRYAKHTVCACISSSVPTYKLKCICCALQFGHEARIENERMPAKKNWINVQPALYASSLFISTLKKLQALIDRHDCYILPECKRAKFLILIYFKMKIVNVQKF